MHRSSPDPAPAPARRPPSGAFWARLGAGLLVCLPIHARCETPDGEPAVAIAVVPSAPTGSVASALPIAPVAPIAPAMPIAPIAPAAPVPASTTPVPALIEPFRDDQLVAALAGLAEHAERSVKAYAQLGTGARPELAGALLSDSGRQAERHLDTLAAASRRIGPARVRQLALRWRTLREATSTRPSPDIARLMDDVAGQLVELTDQYAGELARSARSAADARPAAARLVSDAAASGPTELSTARQMQRQRLLAHRIAKAHLLDCWGAVAVAPAAMIQMRSEFGHLTAAAMLRAATEGFDADLVTFQSQWGLLAAALDGLGGRCDAVAMGQVATTSERLVQLLDAVQPKGHARIR